MECLRTQERIASEISKIEAGPVWANCYHAYPEPAAFGGYKKSGTGRERHKVSMDDYQQPKIL